MSRFDLAIPIVLRREGGFANDAADPGGATNFGVSLRWLKAQGLLEELEHEESDLTHDEVMAVKLMTRDQAAAFYQKYWWNRYAYSNILAQVVATKIFDTAVNLGPPRAHRIAQQVVGVTQDGILGPGTLHELNTRNSLEVVTGLQTAQAQFYRDLVTANPARQKFLAGWLRRALDQC